MKKTYIAETDRKGLTLVFEGEQKEGHTFSVSRCICEVPKQQTLEEQKEIAEMIVKALTVFNK